uniref:START domain-containing protein n=1 Tax=Leptocylindrus danicus TaxID=163516 RepID=A0A7S2L8G5_9STRA
MARSQRSLSCIYPSPDGNNRSSSKRYSLRNMRSSLTTTAAATEQAERDSAAAIEQHRQLITLSRDILRAKQTEFDALNIRAKDFQQARENLVEDDDWTLAQTLFGITTSYRREEDGTLSVKLEGELSGVPLFEQLAVLREVDLYTEWAPFCSKADKLAQVGKIEVVAHQVMSVPLLGLSRDVAFRALGCDCMREDGSIIIVAASVDEFPGIEIPPAPTRIGSARMLLRSFQAKVDVLSPSSARTRLVANIDPKLALPQWLIDFSMKKIAGLVLVCLQSMAKKVMNNPERKHGKRIQEDSEFYRDWLLPKFEQYCHDLGWDMPNVSAFCLGKRRDFVRTLASDSFATDDASSIRSSSSKLSLKSLRRLNKRIFGHYAERKKRKREKRLLETEQKHQEMLRPRELSDDELRRYERLQEKRHILVSMTPEKFRNFCDQPIPEEIAVSGGAMPAQTTKAQGNKYSHIISLMGMYVLFFGIDLSDHISSRGYQGIIWMNLSLILQIAAYIFVIRSIGFVAFIALEDHVFFYGKKAVSRVLTIVAICVSVLIVIGCMGASAVSTLTDAGTSWQVDAIARIKSTMAHSATFFTMLVILGQTLMDEHKSSPDSELRGKESIGLDLVSSGDTMSEITDAHLMPPSRRNWAYS